MAIIVTAEELAQIADNSPGNTIEAMILLPNPKAGRMHAILEALGLDNLKSEEVSAYHSLVYNLMWNAAQDRLSQYLRGNGIEFRAPWPNGTIATLNSAQILALNNSGYAGQISMTQGSEHVYCKK